MNKSKFKGISFPLFYLAFYMLTGVFFINVKDYNPVSVTSILNIVFGFFAYRIYRLIKVDRDITDVKGYGDKLKFLLLIGPLVWFLGQSTGSMILHHLGDSSFSNYQNSINANPGLMVVLTIIIAPIFEEVLFRGFMYSSFKGSLNSLLAISLQAMLFALIHGTLTHMVPTFLLGFYLALIIELTGEIKFAIIGHTIYNLFSVFFGGLVYMPKSIIGITAVILLDFALVISMINSFYSITEEK